MLDDDDNLGVVDVGPPEEPEVGEGGEEEEIPGDVVEEPEEPKVQQVDERAWFDRASEWLWTQVVKILLNALL